MSVWSSRESLVSLHSSQSALSGGTSGPIRGAANNDVSAFDPLAAGPQNNSDSWEGPALLQPYNWPGSEGDEAQQSGFFVPANDVLKSETLSSPGIGEIVERQKIEDIKGVLSGHKFDGRGASPDVHPFKFHVLVAEHGTWEPQTHIAEGAGLEGFSATLSRLVSKGARFDSRFIDHCKEYLKTVLYPFHEWFVHDVEPYFVPVARTDAAVTALHRAFSSFVSFHVRELQRKVLDYSDSRRELAKNTTQYHIFLRPFGLQNWRERHGLPNPPEKRTGRFFEDLIESDLQWFKEHGFNCLRFLGTYPIGQLNSKAKDKGAGSPFAAQSFALDEASHGRAEAAKTILDIARKQYGIHAAFEFVPNHYACDAPIVREDPTLFVHTLEKPADLSGWFEVESKELGTVWVRHGGYYHEGEKARKFWTDTAQLDFSNPRTVELIAQQTIDIIRKTGATFIRVDSAFQLKHSKLELNWGAKGECPSEMQNSLPNQEVLKTYVQLVREQCPGVVLVAEALGGHFDFLSECGFDLIYGMYNMERKGDFHHIGFHEALRRADRDPKVMREAIWRASYLHGQVGGADIIVFNGQLDEKAPHKVFPDERWFEGATLLTFLKPGAFSHYGGVETGFEMPCDEDQKVFTFNKSFQIDWSSRSEKGDFMIKLMKLRAQFYNEYGSDITFTPLTPKNHEETWVGFAVRSASSDKLPTVVLANPSDRPTSVTIKELPEFKLINSQNGKLAPVGEAESYIVAIAK